MEKVMKQVEVSKAADAMAAHMVALIAECKKALADGFQPGMDLPVLLAQAVQNLVPAVGEVAQVVADAKEDLAPVAKALALQAEALLIALK